MHISLDSALGRQRRLNSVGESVFQIAPNPSAGYSLRSLTGGDPAVVRVRRASDNSEKDFNSSGVSSGELVNWVNAQIVPPLDVRELVDGERTGALIPAAAAYSLRNLSTSYTGDVVDVRRSSDDTEDSFTAAEVADGTLLSFANPTYTVGTSVESASKPFDSFTSNGNDGFTATNNTTGSATAGFPYTFATGDVISVSFDLVIANNATPTFILSGNNMGSGSLTTGTTFTSSGSYTQEVTSGSGTGTHLAFTEGNTGTFTISNFKVTSHKADGFVSKWYDQSGNANHATQGTNASQPKIVDAGSLVSGGLDFDGVDDQLDFTALNATDLAIFSVVQFDSVSGQERILGEDSSNSEGFGIGNATNGFFRANGGSATQPALNATVSTSGTFLYSANRASNTLGFFTQGVASATATNSDAFNANSIGGSTNPVDGKIQEIIIYNSDQSDNRTAFEANIGETYGIDLPSGVDTGYDEVDGFVETWYDQSGNGNDAVQLTAGSQPKIVDAGTLVSGGLDFDGVDDYLNRAAVLTNIQDAFMTLVATARNSTGGHICDASTSPDRFVIQADQFNYGDPSDNITLTMTDDEIELITASASSGTMTGYQNGSSAGTAVSDEASSAGTMSIGAFTNGAGPFDGLIAEIIIYDSDQSANRVAIETNINNQYDIY